MKKLLTILGSVGLTATAVAPVTSCSIFGNDKKIDISYKNENGTEYMYASYTVNCFVLNNKRFDDMQINHNLNSPFRSSISADDKDKDWMGFYLYAEPYGVVGHDHDLRKDDGQLLSVKLHKSKDANKLGRTSLTNADAKEVKLKFDISFKIKVGTSRVKLQVGLVYAWTEKTDLNYYRPVTSKSSDDNDWYIEVPGTAEINK